MVEPDIEARRDDPLANRPDADVCRQPLAIFAVVALVLLIGCASQDVVQSPPVIDAAVYRRAETDRTAQFRAEIERLRADLHRAEEALVLVESDLSGGAYTRADAVSSLAEARIEVERIGAGVPWRADEIADARRKLDEAEVQIGESHYGAALFFVYRARRIAERASLEAEVVKGRRGTLFVKAKQINLRAGPSVGEAIVAVLREGTPVFPEDRQEPWVLVRGVSGSVGWVHRNLVAPEHRSAK